MEEEPDDTQTRAPSRRRTARLVSSIRVRVEPEGQVAFEAATAVVSRHGALLLSPQFLEAESIVQLTNLEKGLSQTFRVVWCGDGSSGAYKTGVELLDPGLNFWGLPHQYEPDD